MPLLPTRFYFRFNLPCRYLRDMPRDDDSLFEMPESHAMRSPALAKEPKPWADLRAAWNEFGFGIDLAVTGKSIDAVGDAERPAQSDGLTLWIDTRGDRTGHRATRTCHQFIFLPKGGGPEKDQPVSATVKINRALQDAPLASPDDLPFVTSPIKGGYRLQAFIPATALSGFDPEQFPRWGLFYAVRDAEHGVTTLGQTEDFPYADDPSLWATVDLTRPETR